MRWRPMVVLPLPAEPCTAMRPEAGCVISSNWRGSMIAEALLVGVPFLVAVEEARDGRVAPVDDLHAAARLDEAARADQDVAPLAILFEAQVPEVGRLAIDRRRVPLAALARQRLDSVHLLEDRPLVLRLRLGQGIAQLDERAGVVDLDAALAGGASIQLAQDHR